MSTQEDWPNGFCAACKQIKTPEGHDPCIANLPGVLFACCGHGNTFGYIKFTDGRCLEFNPLEVDIDIPSVIVDDVPIFQLGGSRRFSFIKKKVFMNRMYTNVVSRKQKD